MKTVLKVAFIEVAYYLFMIGIVVTLASMLGGGKLLGELIAFVQYQGGSSPLVVSIFFVAGGISIIAFKFKKKPIADFSLEDSIAMVIGMIIAAIISWIISIIVVLLALEFYIAIMRFFSNMVKGYQSFPR